MKAMAHAGMFDVLMVIRDNSLSEGVAMRADLDKQFPATTIGLYDAVESIDRLCTARHVHPALVSRARIIVEELFTNTIKHGHGGECDRPVRLRLKTSPVLQLTYEDDAAHFDPTQWKAGHHPDSPPDQQPEGQAGIAMVMGLSSNVRHTRGPNGNRLAITIELQNLV
jgi:anti-sigma regulatory factor (Ser/Thr protein kinase)